MKAYPTTPAVQVTASETSITPHAGVALWGTLLDRLGLEPLVDERLSVFSRERGYSEGELVRTLVETQLAGGDFCSDVSLLSDPATGALRGGRPTPDPTTLTRFLGRVTPGSPRVMNALLTELLRRAWALGAAPGGERVTIDLDSTEVRVYGSHKQGARFNRKGMVGLHPLQATVGETGEVVALRLRAGNRHTARGAAHFCARALRAVMRADPAEERSYWVRADSGFYSQAVTEAVCRAGATFSITARQDPKVARLISEVATSEETAWEEAVEMEASQVSETEISFGGGTYRLLVRRTLREPDAQLSFFPADAYRYQAVITNSDLPAQEVEYHHRLRGGKAEEAVRELKEGFGLSHLPVGGFFGNWVWAQCAAIAYNVALWLRHLALPSSFRSVRVKRLRLFWLNVPARLVRSARRLILRFAKGYRYVAEFARALERLQDLPRFA